MTFGRALLLGAFWFIGAIVAVVIALLVWLCMAIAAPAAAQDSLGAYWAGEAARTRPERASGHGRGGKAPLQLPGALLAEAGRYIGRGNPTGFRGPWCGEFLALVARRVGRPVPPAWRLAASWRHAGPRLSGPRIGALAVWSHHVSIIAAHGRGWVIGVGGNQSGDVRASRFSTRGAWFVQA